MNEQDDRTEKKAESDKEPISGGEALDSDEDIPPVLPSGQNTPIVVVETKNGTIHQAQRTPNESQVKNANPERWMTVLTAIIALATIANVLVFYYESEGSSQDIKTFSDKAGTIVGAIDTAISNSQVAIAGAFHEN